MQIVLLRHGKPIIKKDASLNAAEFGLWVEKYNTAGIDNDFKPPQLAIDQAVRCTFTVCSNLPRSLESAKALGVENIGVCEAMFREMDMPYAKWRSPKLSSSVWSVFFRLIWALGYSANSESFSAAKGRARDCAERLADLASTHGTVLFVGHGSLNWFIAKHLKDMGWSGSDKSPRKYWEFSVYRYQAA